MFMQNIICEVREMDLMNTNFTEEELYKLNIHELRDIARQIGVHSPTTKKKEELVELTLQIIYGVTPAVTKKKGAGRPVRTKTKPSRIVYDLQNQEGMHGENADNLFTSKYKVDPTTIFMSNAEFREKVASKKSEYKIDEHTEDDESMSLSAPSDMRFVSGVVVIGADEYYLEVESADGGADVLYKIDDGMVKANLLGAGDSVQGYANKKYGIVTTISSVNGEFMI